LFKDFSTALQPRLLSTASTAFQPSLEMSDVHTSRHCVRFKEPHVDVYPVCKVMFPYELFDAESISCEWT